MAVPAIVPAHHALRWPLPHCRTRRYARHRMSAVTVRPLVMPCHVLGWLLPPLPCNAAAVAIIAIWRAVVVIVIVSIIFIAIGEMFI